MRAAVAPQQVSAEVEEAALTAAKAACRRRAMEVEVEMADAAWVGHELLEKRKRPEAK